MQPTSIWGVVFWVLPIVLVKTAILITLPRSLAPSTLRKLNLLPSFLAAWSLDSCSGRTCINKLYSVENFANLRLSWDLDHTGWYLQGHVFFPEVVVESGAESGCCPDTQQPYSALRSGGSGIKFVSGRQSQIHFPTLYVGKHN